jgi:hypothetical protein
MSMANTATLPTAPRQRLGGAIVQVNYLNVATWPNDHIQMTYRPSGKVDPAHSKCGCLWDSRSYEVCSMQSPSMKAMFHNININV